jgi:replicative DNA helicase
MSSDSLLKRYLLGLIKNKGTEARFWLKPHHINDPFYRQFISEIYTMWKTGVSLTPELIVQRVNRSMHNLPISEEQKTSRILSTISDAQACDVTKTEVKDIHDEVMKQYVYAEAKGVLTNLQKNMDNPETLDEALAAMRRLKSQEPTQVADLRKQLIEARDEAVNGSRSLIKFGVPSLDKALGGLNRAEVEIIAGRPGHGKTSLACQFVLNWLDMGYRVAVFSKEMTSSRLIHKLVANVSDDLTSDILKRGDLTDRQKVKLAQAVDQLLEKYEGRLFIYDDVYDSHHIETLCAKHQPDIVLDDFVQLSRMDDGNIRLEIQRIVKHYKEIAKTYNLCFLTLSQLNRGIEGREDPRPRLSDLAESGALEQLAADVLFVFYPFKNDYTSPKNQVEVIASKTRYGETCRTVLHFDGDHMRYREMPRLNA